MKIHTCTYAYIYKNKHTYTHTLYVGNSTCHAILARLKANILHPTQPKVAHLQTVRRQCVCPCGVCVRARACVCVCVCVCVFMRVSHGTLTFVLSTQPDSMHCMPAVASPFPQKPTHRSPLTGVFCKK